MAKYLGFASAFFVFLFIIVFSPFFEIKSVIIEDGQECLESLSYNVSEKFIGQNLIFLNTQEIADSLKDEIDCLDYMHLEKKFPTQIIINIKTKSPVANLNETNLQATENGLIVRKDNRQNLPTLFLPADFKNSLAPGEEIKDEMILSAIKISASLLKTDFTPASIRIVKNDEIAVYSSKDLLVTFTSLKEIDMQMNSLQLILGKAKIDAAKIAKIDLRFDKPVITYQ